MALFKAIRLVFYFVFLVAVLGAYYVYLQAINKPLNNRTETIVVPAGVGVAWLSAQLQKKQIIESRYIFRAFTLMNYSDASIKAGEYNLVDVNNMAELVEKLIEGRVIQYSLTLVEGKTHKEYRAQLMAQKGLKDKLIDMDDAQIMRELGAPGRHPEGQFAPQTYFYTKGDSDFDVLKQAFLRQQAILEKAWAARADDVEVRTAYELLTMASIIEKETGVPEERPEISGVFNNRLRIGMRLQTDPTVIYGMGDAYDGNIRRKDLRTDTEYNTYTRFGLPPTPIAMPGEAAIMAAANPQTTQALYFVGKGDGTHQFSTNLNDHNEAVIKYQLGGKRKSFSSNPEGN